MHGKFKVCSICIYSDQVFTENETKMFKTVNATMQLLKKLICQHKIKLNAI